MKSTKKSFIMSLLSLMLCFAMLLGTTYAWFTDSVTSGRNKIIAGNLDVELYAGNTKVGPDTMLFDVDFWEPGMVVYENFTVKNAGNLALKYQLGMNIGDFNTVDGHSLKEVLKATIVPDGFSGDRAAAQALSGYTTLESFSVSGKGALLPGESQSFAVVICWEPTDNDNLYNLNNGKTATVVADKFAATELGIELGVKLFATQLEYEKDSFDEHYDGSAELEGGYDQSVEPVSKTVSATIAEGQDTVFTVAATPANENGKTTKVTVPAGVASFTAGSTSSMTVEATPTVAANNKFTISSDGAVGAIDLTVKVDDAVVSEFKDESGTAIPVTVETYVAKNMTNVTLAYNGIGAQPELVSYDKDTGKLVFKTTHFSTFVLGADEVAYVESNNTAYLTLADAMLNISSGDTLTILKNFNLTSQTTSGLSADKCTIDLNGKTITASGTWKLSNTVKEYMTYEEYLELDWDSPSREEYEADPYLLGMKENPVDVTIKNGTYVVNGTDSGRIRFEHGSTGVFEDMTFKTSNSKWYQALQTYATNSTGTNEVNKYSFKGCTFDNCFIVFDGKSGSCNEYQINFDDCAFTAANMSNGAACIKVGAYGYGTMNISNTTFDINNTNNGGYCVYPDTLRSYTNNRKMSVSLNNVTMNTSGNANPYTYDYDYNSADGSRDWSAEVTCSGTNVFTHNGKTVQMFIKETNATNKSVAWTENSDAYKTALAEWVNYASASPACADYASSNYYLVECNGYYFVGGQGTQFNDNATVTKNGDTVTKVVVSGYFTPTYNTIGTTDISAQLGATDNTSVHIYTLAL